jgi:hypothetical protein
MTRGNKGSPNMTNEMVVEAIQALAAHNGNIAAASKQLNLERHAFRYRLQKGREWGLYDVEPNKKNDPIFDEVPERLEHHKAYFKKLEKADNLVQKIYLKDDKPFVLTALGDPHLDNQGTDLDLWEKWNNAIKQDRWRGCCLGDVLDNWVGKLERLYGDNRMTREDAELFFRYYVKEYSHLWDWFIGGNHDKWPDMARMIKIVLWDAKVPYRTDEMKIEYHTPSGHVVKVKARHNFKGNSMYSTDHGVKRDAMFTGSAYDILLGGDLHVSGYTPVKSPEGVYCHAVQLGAFKIVDEYAMTCGFYDKHISPAVALVIDPRKDRTDFTRVRVFHDIEGAGIMLRGLMG